MPIVALHPLGADHRIWDGLAEHLGGDARVLRYDFPGHGDAPSPEGSLSIESLSSQLAEALDREGLEDVCLVGMSLGGSVAQHCAAVHPTRVGSLILADCVAAYPATMRHGWLERARIARADGVQGFVESTVAVWFSKSARNSHEAAYARSAMSRVSPAGYAAMCEALAEQDTTELVRAIDVPTLVVCGVDDVAFMRTGAEWLRANISGACLEWLDPGAHAAPLENPSGFARAVRGFLADQGKPAGA